MSRRIAVAVGSIAFVITAVFLMNYLLVYRPLSFVVDSDTRNKGVSVLAHYDYLINPNILVFDLRDLSDSKAPLDIFRVLLEFAAVQKNQDYEVVKIAFRGKTKFLLMGSYFKTLGAEHGSQNPIYTIRTFSEHLYKPDGTAAFQTWTGGLLGVLAKQMEDFSDFSKQWYMYDLAKSYNTQIQGKEE